MESDFDLDRNFIVSSVFRLVKDSLCFRRRHLYFNLFQSKEDRSESELTKSGLQLQLLLHFKVKFCCLLNVIELLIKLSEREQNGRFIVN